MGLAGYRRPGAMLTGRPSKRARMAIGVANHLWRNRGKYRRAAKVIGKAWRARARRRASMARIGTTPGTAQCKRASVAKDTFTGSTRTLYFTELQDITKTTTNEIDKRQRDVVKLSGVKLCIEVNHLQTAPLLVNYAIVYDKRSNDGTTTVNTGDFFRANGGTQRAKDFSTVLSSAEFHCLPLNTDRFTVLWHKRFKLGVNTPSGGYSNNSRENYRMIQKYQDRKSVV